MGERRQLVVLALSPCAGSLLKVQFDLNPIDSTADQKIRAELLPVQVIYDAVS